MYSGSAILRRLVALGILLLLAGSSRAQLTPQEKVPSIVSFPPLRPAPGDSKLRKLRVARYNEAVAELVNRAQAFESGPGTWGPHLLAAFRRALRAGLDTAEKPAARVALLGDFLKRAKELENVMGLCYEAQKTFYMEVQYHEARGLRLEIEIQLLEAKDKAGLADQK
jgi:hypothetical protein